MQAKRPSTHHKNDWEPTFNTYPSVTLSSVPPYKCEFSNLTPLCGVNIMHLLSDPLATCYDLTQWLEENCKTMKNKITLIMFRCVY